MLNKSNNVLNHHRMHSVMHLFTTIYCWYIIRDQVKNYCKDGTGANRCWTTILMGLTFFILSTHGTLYICTSLLSSIVRTNKN